MLWERCIEQLESELSQQQVNTWIRPLQARVVGTTLELYAPNSIVRDWVTEHFLENITTAANGVTRSSDNFNILINVGAPPNSNNQASRLISTPTRAVHTEETPIIPNLSLDSGYTFDKFVKGESNQMAFAAARQVSTNPGDSYNPLLIYGASGLGKTHLMQGIGHTLKVHNPDMRIAYIGSERFVSELVRSIQHKKMDQFKNFYRKLDVLLLDDVHFLAGKDTSQDEFFHTFNSLLEGKKQIVVTCDRYPKEIERLEDRLVTRLGWGLTVQVNPPDLETRAAIVMTKGEQRGWRIPEEVAFFIAKRVRSNVRELEGSLQRVTALADFKGVPVSMDIAREALHDLLHVQERMITIENIQKVVADYYKLRVQDLKSKTRSRSIARPRQMAMYLSKKLTNHSLPEIGRGFGGKDHTTVLHACKKVKSLRDEDSRINDDYQHLIRILSP